MTFAPRACPVCLRLEQRTLYSQRFASVPGQMQLAGYDVVVCEGCGAGFASRIPEQEWFDAYYAAVSKYTYEQRDGAESPFDIERFEAIARTLASHCPDRATRVLDVGCASGGQLRQLKELGYRSLMGTDPSPASTELARVRYGINVVTDDLATVARSEAPFGLLIQVGVLEHIADVQGALAAMRAVLASDGMMYVEVPDAEGFHRWPGAPFQQFSIEHINFFSRRSLTRALGLAGFEPVEVVSTARPHSANAMMPVVAGVYRVAERPAGGTDELESETLTALQRYVDDCRQAERNVADVIAGLVRSGRRLLVWGVGTHTLHLLETTEFARLNIVAFVDSNPNYQARELLGRPVIAPSAVAKHDLPILISSQVFQDEIRHQLRHTLGLQHELVLLYPESGS